MSSNKDFLPSSFPMSSMCAIEIEAVLLLFMMNCYRSSFQECITIIVLLRTSRHIVYISYKKRLQSASPGRVVLGLPTPSPRVCTDGRTDRRTDGRWRQNQNFSDQRVTKFAYPWCSASSAKNRLFCSKFCSDTLILLEFCSLPETFSALQALCILRKYGREPGPNPLILAEL